MPGSRVDITPEVIENVKFEQRHFRWLAWTIREMWKTKSFNCHNNSFSFHLSEPTYNKCPTCIYFLGQTADEWAYYLQGHGRFTREVFIRAVMTGSEKMK